MRDMAPRSHRIARAPTRPETRIPATTGPASPGARVVKWRDSQTQAAAMTGADSRKEYRAASARLNPSQSAAVIVAPEREKPGRMATAWAQPISIASAMVSERAVRFLDGRALASYRATAPSAIQADTESGPRKCRAT